jgi:hypothetical protein
VVDALQRIHGSLEPGGTLIDTQPLSPRPHVCANGQTLGRVDMREWSRTIEAVDARVDEAVDAGLYSIEREQRLMVADSWDGARESAEMIGGWKGTRLSAALERRILAASPPLTITQEVRLRVLRAR